MSSIYIENQLTNTLLLQRDAFNLIDQACENKKYYKLKTFEKIKAFIDDGFKLACNQQIGLRIQLAKFQYSLYQLKKLVKNVKNDFINEDVLKKRLNKAKNSLKKLKGWHQQLQENPYFSERVICISINLMQFLNKDLSKRFQIISERHAQSIRIIYHQGDAARAKFLVFNEFMQSFQENASQELKMLSNCCKNTWVGLPKSENYCKITYANGDVAKKLEKQKKCAALQAEMEEEKDFAASKHRARDRDQIKKEGSKQACVAYAQGARDTMEDAHLITNLNIGDQQAALYGVFDGHGGADSSKFVAEELPKILQEELFQMPEDVDKTVFITDLLTRVCFVLHHNIFFQEIWDGTTLTCVLRYSGKLYTFNVGDSRTICINQEGAAIQLSEDQNPGDKRFDSFPKKLAPNVFQHNLVVFDPDDGFDKRLFGVLAMNRSLGDFDLYPFNSFKPKITCIDEEKGMILVIACDGLWDIGSTRQVGKYIQDNRERSAKTLATRLVNIALQSGSTDNITALVVKL